MSAFREAVARRAEAVGIAIPPDLVRPLENYVALLARWNRTVNLTALPLDPLGDEAVDRLLLEPIAAARFFPERADAWVDLGTGGGSPAIPLKLLRPGTRLRMVESRSRKVAFLREVIRDLGLPAATAEPMRFETLFGSLDWTASADLVTGRAVRVDTSFVRLAEQLLKPSGLLLLFETAERRSLDSALLRGISVDELIPGKKSHLNVFTRTA